jgi:tetratricopeptide (TPR) repeat protein
MKSRMVIMQAFLVLLAVLVSSVAGAQDAVAPTGGDSAAAARKLLAQGQYAEALALAEPGVKADPSNAGLRMCQVDALLGLHRILEARALALSSSSLGPGFRFKAGVATLKFGQAMGAVDLWKPLYADKDWAAPAYAESVKALLAAGKEPEAKALLAEALQKVSPPSSSLLMLSLTLDTGKASSLATLGKLKVADPANAGKYDSLAKLYSASEGDLCQESFEGKLPAVIDIKDRSERQETSSLNWDAGSAKGASEGGKTNVMLAPSRILLEAGINGERSEPMALDSSCATVLIAPKLAQKLKLERLAPGEYGGIGLTSPAASQWVLLKEMKVGPVTFKNVPALIIDEKTEYWKETGGVIPLWMFRHYGVHYDWRHNKLTLLASGTSPDEALGAGNLQLRTLWFGAVPYVETRLQSKPGVYLKVGSLTFGTYVEERRAADLGVVQRNTQGGIPKERGLFNIFSSGVADNVTLDLGSTRINLPTIRVANLCADCEVDCSGVIGRNILDLFDMYFDYSAGTLSLKGYEKGR